MSSYKQKFNEFCKIADHLAKQNIRVLLFGSVGLQQRLNVDLFPDDIDILVPKIFIHEKWEVLRKSLEDIGYTLADLHEHQFSNGVFKVAFAELEELTSFAGIDIDCIPLVRSGGTEYLLLTLKQYLQVYTESSKDGYRRNKNNDKDLTKIDLIQKRLAEYPTEEL